MFCQVKIHAYTLTMTLCTSIADLKWPMWIKTSLWNICFCACSLQIIFESQEEHHLKQRERPRAMHVQASRILASNYRGLDTGSKADLVKCLNKFQQSPLFNQHQPPEAEFPNQACDIPVMCDKMISHASGTNPQLTKCMYVVKACVSVAFCALLRPKFMTIGHFKL